MNVAYTGVFICPCNLSSARPATETPDDEIKRHAVKIFDLTEAKARGF